MTAMQRHAAERQVYSGLCFYIIYLMYPRLPASVCTGGMFHFWLLYLPLVVYLAFVPSSPSLLFPHSFSFTASVL